MRIDTARAKELRRQTLRVLRAAQGGGYEGWLSLRTIWSLVRTELDDLSLSELSEAVLYLAGKGYAETRKRRATKFERAETDARLLPRGVDLLEETIPPDPGVEDERV